MASPEDGALAVLRPALELALAVARSGVVEIPPVPAPGPVRPLLGFAKLSERAPATLRECVEDDGKFRRRVAEQADQAVIGRLPYVWLTRPEGWTEELQAATRQRREAEEEAAGERAERRARRRLGAVEAALARAEVDAAKARRGAADAAEELAGERQQRRRSDEEAQRLGRSLATITGTASDLEGALADATAARRELQALLDDAHRRIDDLIAERDAALRGAERADLVAVTAEAGLAARQRRADTVRGALGRAVDEAADAARLLGAALAAAAGALEVPGQPGGATQPPVSAPARLSPAEPARPSRLRVNGLGRSKEGESLRRAPAASRYRCLRRSSTIRQRQPSSSPGLPAW